MIIKSKYLTKDFIKLVTEANIINKFSYLVRCNNGMKIIKIF